MTKKKLECPFCKSLNCVLLEKVNSHLNKKDYDLNKCNKCGLQFFTPPVFEDIYLNEGFLGQIDYYNEIHKGRTEASMWSQKIFDEIRENRIEIKNKKIIDIGGADGVNFDVLVKDFGINPEDYYILEGDERSIMACKKRGIKNIIPRYLSEDLKVKEKFDIVIMSGIIEHFTDLKVCMNAIFKMCNEGALIFIVTPNRNRWFLKWKVGLDVPPHHFYRFDKKFFRDNFRDELIEISTFERKKPYIDSAKSISDKLKLHWLLLYPFIPILRMANYFNSEELYCLLKVRSEVKK